MQTITCKPSLRFQASRSTTTARPCFAVRASAEVCIQAPFQTASSSLWLITQSQIWPRACRVAKRCPTHQRRYESSAWHLRCPVIWCSTALPPLTRVQSMVSCRSQPFPRWQPLSEQLCCLQHPLMVSFCCIVNSTQLIGKHIQPHLLRHLCLSAMMSPHWRRRRTGSPQRLHPERP